MCYFLLKGFLEGFRVPFRGSCKGLGYFTTCYLPRFGKLFEMRLFFSAGLSVWGVCSDRGLINCNKGFAEYLSIFRVPGQQYSNVKSPLK